MNKLFFILSFLFLFVHTTWASCSPYSNEFWGVSENNCRNGYFSGPTLSSLNLVCDWLECGSYGGVCNLLSSSSASCGNSKWYNCKVCNNSCEADSLKCIQAGNTWGTVETSLCGGKGCKTCDTTFTCISYPYTYCEDVPSSGEITCINGNCYGLGGSKWVSYYDNNCTNECGATQNTRVSGDTVYVPGGSCEDPLQCDPTTHCVDFSNGTYFLYQNCLVGRQVVGNVDNRQTITQFTLSGVGSCKDNGYSSETYPNSGGGNSSNPNHSQADSISSDCTIYGIGCEQYQDTTNYQNGDNANPTNCWCEPFDGSNSVSYIKCPDGSSRIVYMSCYQWHNYFSSSSTAPPPSSGSGGGGASSGSTGQSSSDSNPFQGKYPEYPTDQPTTNKNVQGALSGISSFVISIRDHLSQLKNYIMSTQNVEFDSVKSRSHGDYSQLDTVQSDLGFTFDSLFSKIDTSRKIIDTSKFVSNGTCPIIKGEFSLCKKFGIFKGNKDVDLEFDLSNFFGFNLCTIIKALILGFTSVVVFILSFRVISKSGM